MKANYATKKSFRIYLPEKLILARNKHFVENKDELIADGYFTESILKKILSERTDDVMFEFPVPNFSHENYDNAIWNTFIPWVMEWGLNSPSLHDMFTKLQTYEVTIDRKGKERKTLAQYQLSEGTFFFGDEPASDE